MEVGLDNEAKSIKWSQRYRRRGMLNGVHREKWGWGEQASQESHVAPFKGRD